MEATRIATMIDRLPEEIHNPDNSDLMRQAAVECFFVHLRTLVEFLGVRPQDRRDVFARDTFWELPEDAALIQRLNQHWLTASRQVAHFSQDRIMGPQVSTELADLKAMADDILAVWDSFAAASAHALVPKRADFSLWK
jgi:hypothetical protein